MVDGSRLMFNFRTGDPKFKIRETVLYKHIGQNFLAETRKTKEKEIVFSRSQMMIFSSDPLFGDDHITTELPSAILESYFVEFAIPSVYLLDRGAGRKLKGISIYRHLAL